MCGSIHTFFQISQGSVFIVPYLIEVLGTSQMVNYSLSDHVLSSEILVCPMAYYTFVMIWSIVSEGDRTENFSPICRMGCTSSGIGILVIFTIYFSLIGTWFHSCRRFTCCICCVAIKALGFFECVRDFFSKARFPLSSCTPHMFGRVCYQQYIERNGYSRCLGPFWFPPVFCISHWFHRQE